MQEDFINKLNKDWELVGEYTNIKTPTLFRHNVCGHTYMKTPSVVLAKPHSCRFCNAKRMSISSEELNKRIADKLDRYEILSEPNGWDNLITVRHKKCGRTFEARLGVFVKSKEGCPFCKSGLLAKKAAMTHEDFLSKLGDRAREYEFITKYHRAHEKITVRHNCGNVFEITPDNMLRGGRCKACKHSTGEGDLFRHIKQIEEDAVQGDRTVLPSRRELDIYVPSCHLAIEYDGLRYHSVEHFLEDNRRNWSYAYASKYHLWKTEQCYNEGIRLVHIYEDEWTEKKDIVLDMLNAILHGKADKIYARQTTVALVRSNEANEFLEANHIQGKVRAEYYVGAYYNNELVAVQSYSKLRKSLGGNQNGTDWELTRYATKRGYSVVGGFSKCLSYFVRSANVSRIISYGDLRVIDRNNNVYLKNGFKQTAVCAPSYYYVKGNKRYHRFNFRRQMIKKKFGWVYSEEKTEKEMMRELGYERIYDCGKIRYEYIPTKNHLA